jgi:hypothetical protein
LHEHVTGYFAQFELLKSPARWFPLEDAEKTANSVVTSLLFNDHPLHPRIHSSPAKTDDPLVRGTGVSHFGK